MNNGNRMIRKVVIAAVAGALTLSCNEINRQTAPVQLIVTNSNALHQVDLANGAAGCNRSLGTIQVQSLLIQQGSTAPQTFNDVRIDRYQVTYNRTDGGKLIPQPFVRAIDTVISTGASASVLNDFVAFAPDAFTQAPFAALQPQNGGRDPETGLKHVSMEIVLQVFGQTLAGERVSGSTRIALDFCNECGGCF
jgi:hypothetical protein